MYRSAPSGSGARRPLKPASGHTSCCRTCRMTIRNAQPESGANRPVVLAVDDDERVLEAIGMILENYEVLATTTGAAALAVVRSRRVDCVLLDLLMPGIDGLQVLAEIKAVDPGLDVILVSGLGQPQAVATAMKLGAFEYLVKPFAEEDLLGFVAEAVGRRRANVATFLLIGEDAGVIASIAVILEPHTTVATAAPRLAMLPDPGRHTPLLVIYDSGLAAPLAANFVERLHERYSRSKILVLPKPFQLHDVLQHITILAPSLWELSVRSSRLGAPLLRLMDFVAKSYHQPLGAQDLARAVGYSVHHLAHIAHERLGVSLMEDLTRFRFEVARHPPSTTDLTLDQIAGGGGLSDAFHPSRVVLGHSGRPPRRPPPRGRIAGKLAP